MAIQTQTKKGFFDNPVFKTTVKSAQVKIFPEGAIGYFIGPTFAMLANSIISGQFSKYMTDIVNINDWNPMFWTMLPIISALFVVLGNIIVGRLMDRMKTSAGKARPLLLLSIPLAAISLLLLFILSPFANESTPETQIAALVMIAIGYNMWFGIAYPFYFTSHSALVGLSTRNSKDRSLLATISNATHLAAMGLCSMVLPFFSKLLFVPQADGNGIDAIASYNSWKIFVIALLVVNVVGVLMEYYFTRERVTEESMGAHGSLEKKKTVSMGEQAKICFKDKYWVIMIVFFLMFQLGGMLKNVSQVYFCTAWLNEPGDITGQTYHGLISTLGAIPTAIGMVVAWPLSNKIGKAKAIMGGAVVAVIGGAIGFIAPDNFVCVIASFMIKALGSTPAMYLSIALLADIMDHQEAKYRIRTDGLSMMIYGAIMAGMTGIATGAIMGVLGAVGYTAADAQIPAVQQATLWLFIGGETICYAVIAVIFIFMGVEKFGKYDRKAIIADQKADAEARGEEYVDPHTRMEMEERQALEDSRKAAIEEIKADAAKKGLNAEEEVKKYQAKCAEEDKAAAEKKAADDKKKAEKEAAEQAKLDPVKEAAALAEYNKIRVACGRTPIEM